MVYIHKVKKKVKYLSLILCSYFRDNMQRNQIYYIRLEIGMKLFNKYKFSDKRQSLGGIISTIMGLLALASLIYGVYISF